jgi:hypothetical protein
MIERMRWQREPEKMDEFGLCPLADLFQWLLDVEYDCHIWIILDVDDMEMQYWESFTLVELPQKITRQSLYVAPQRRLLE